MHKGVIEESYPITFQEHEAKRLGEYVRQRQCVNLVGMKRVGISNFLRFFLNHDQIIPTYISGKEQHLFIPVDLNDLVEQEIYPFWTLTLKRIVDASDHPNVSHETKNKINELFVRSIQFQDLFLVIDSIRQSIVLLGESGLMPTIFFLRFDRLKDKYNSSFFDNLQGLRDASHGNLSYVFTSYRSLVTIFPGARSNLAVFAQTLYAKPANEKDMRIVYETYSKRYKMELPAKTVAALLKVIGGYMQYLQLGLIYLHEEKKMFSTEEDLVKALLADERIVLQSEELWESLMPDEQRVLLSIVRNQNYDKQAIEYARYLWDTGFVIDENEKTRVFSPLFMNYLFDVEKERRKKKKTAHLTRKENLLYTLLKDQLGEICEREKIIECVWPESLEFGVSDWAIDRLVARVRLKMKEQNTPYEIQTIRTRGYKLSVLKE